MEQALGEAQLNRSFRALGPRGQSIPSRKVPAISPVRYRSTVARSTEGGIGVGPSDPYPGTTDRISFRISLASPYSNGALRNTEKAERISQSGRLSPTGLIAGRTDWTWPSVLVKVPAFSMAEAAGSTTWASWAVSVRNSS